MPCPQAQMPTCSEGYLLSDGMNLCAETKTHSDASQKTSIL